MMEYLPLLVLAFIAIFFLFLSTIQEKQKKKIEAIKQQMAKEVSHIIEERMGDFLSRIEERNKDIETRWEKKFQETQRQFRKGLAELRPRNEAPLLPASKPSQELALSHPSGENPHTAILETISKQNSPLYFVMGSAGTGKTCFIHKAREWMNKNNLNVITLAYTGVAALEAQGQTIHSFCKFPPHYVTPKDIRKTYDYNLIRHADLIIIDEVSMVSANIMDSMDKFFRLNRKEDSFFGGLTVLLVGDLFQLPPVIKPEDLDNHKAEGYENGFFFNSFCMRDQQSMIVKELTRSYRHRDPSFRKILNSVRFARDVQNVLPIINVRCIPQEDRTTQEIHLTSTRNLADERNMREMTAIKEPVWTYEGEIKGVFPQKENLPSPQKLEIKKGAQVIFTKNDRGKRWVNGSLGIVETPEEHSVFVRLLRNDEIVEVFPETWENVTVKYKKGKFEKEVLGEYIQIPLMLAWAMTIHKSQGKTIDRININLGSGAFVPGQTYVALSRVRELEHLRLERPLRQDDIFINNSVYGYYQNVFAKQRESA